jgi:uncharacterized protein YceK
MLPLKFDSTFFGDRNYMRFHCSVSKLTWSALLLPVALFVAVLSGCGSDADSTEAKQARKERAAAIAADEAKDQAEAKGRRGKKAAVTKSIKGRLGTD